ncbi:MAG TPA: zinc ribbon domain-containing protein [Blastocatellia bacterium]|nr:zinc ribbon domain-containing protein [Blastocatellia bacterium]
MNLNMIQPEILKPGITAMGNCQSCGELVQLGTAKCPSCGILLDQQRMRESAKVNFAITQAISSANTIRTFKPAAYLLALIAVGRFFLDFRLRNNFLLTIVWAFPLITIVGWFMKHGALNSVDEEYLESKKHMKSALILWLVTNILNWITLVMVIGRTQ